MECLSPDIKGKFKAAESALSDAEVALSPWIRTLGLVLRERMHSLCRYCLLIMLNTDCVHMLQDQADKEPRFCKKDGFCAYGGLLFGLATPVYLPLYWLSLIVYSFKEFLMREKVKRIEMQQDETRRQCSTTTEKLRTQMHDVLLLCEASRANEEIDKDLQKLSENLQKALCSRWIKGRNLIQVFSEHMEKAKTAAAAATPAVAAAEKATASGQPGPQHGGPTAPVENGGDPKKTPSKSVFTLLLTWQVEGGLKLARKLSALEVVTSRLCSLLEGSKEELKKHEETKHVASQPEVDGQTNAEFWCSVVMWLVYWTSAVYAIAIFLFEEGSFGVDPALARLKAFQPLILLVLNSVIGFCNAGYYKRISASKTTSDRIKTRLRVHPVDCPYDRHFQKAAEVLSVLEQHGEHEKNSRVSSLRIFRVIIGGQVQCTMVQASACFLLCTLQCGSPFISSVVSLENSNDSGILWVEWVLFVVNFIQFGVFLLQCLQAFYAIDLIATKAKHFSNVTDITAARTSSLPYMNILSDRSSVDAWCSIRSYTKTYANRREQTICQLTITVLLLADVAAFLLLLLWLFLNPSSEEEGAFSVAQGVVLFIVLMDISVFSIIVYYVIDRGAAANKGYDQQAKHLVALLYKQSQIIMNISGGGAGLAGEPDLQKHCHEVEMARGAVQRALKVMQADSKPITIAGIALTSQFKKQFTAAVGSALPAAVSAVMWAMSSGEE